MYVADNSNNCIRKVTISTGIITTIVGTGGYGYNGDEIEATSAALNSPMEVVIESSGSNLYIADSNNQRIRKVKVPIPRYHIAIYPLRTIHYYNNFLFW